MFSTFHNQIDMNITNDKTTDPFDIDPELEDSVKTIVFWGGLLLVFMIIGNFMAHVHKNNEYDTFFKNKKKRDECNSLNKELEYYFNDYSDYSKKLSEYSKANRISHYFFNTLILYSIFYIGYLITRYFYFNNASYVIEIMFYLVTLVELFTMISSLTFVQFKNIDSLSAEKDKVCLVIPFGGARIEDKVNMLKYVTDNAKLTFPSDNIYLIHNGKNKTPDINIVNRCKSFGVNYVYLPIPSKSYAIYYSSKYLINKHNSVMMIDDDVLLPENLLLPSFQYDRMDIDMWAHMICAEKPNSNDPFLKKMLIYCQDIEYRFAGFMKQLQSGTKSSTLLSHHGAISLYKKKTLEKVMSKHDGVFDGEDYLMGIIAYNMGYRMKTVPSQYVPTKTPDNIIDFYKQRVYSWDYVILKFVKHHIKILLNFRSLDLVMKLNTFYNLWTVFQDFLRLPNLIIMTFFKFDYKWLVTYLCLATFIKSIGIITVLYFKNKVDHIPMRYGTSLLLIYPIYNIFSYVLRCIAQVRFLLVFENKVCHDVRLQHRPQFPNIMKYYDNLDEINWQTVYNTDNHDINDSITIDISSDKNCDIACLSSTDALELEKAGNSGGNFYHTEYFTIDKSEIQSQDVALIENTQTT